MRRFMMTFAGSVVIVGSSLVAVGQEKAPAQAPAQAPVQAPEKQAPMPAQAPTQKLTPIQKPTQAPTQKYTSAQCQSPIQKGEPMPMKQARAPLFNRYR